MPVWRYVSKEVRDRYERRFGKKPPGYRATGRVEWFAAWHEPEAPCCKCGTVTDRWIIGLAFMGSVPFAGATYHGHALCAETFYAFCWPCERRAAIARLQQRQANPEILATVKAGEAVYLAELVEEECSEVVASDPVCGS